MRHLLPAEEPGVRTLLADVLEDEGITVRTSARVTGVRHEDDAFRLTLEGGQKITGQQVLVATGQVCSRMSRCTRRRSPYANILGRPGSHADYRAMPRATFTDPEVVSVGLTEQAAREQGLRVRTGTARVPSSARGWIHKAGNDGLIKLVEDADHGVLIGATSAARQAVRSSTAWPLPSRPKSGSTGCGT
jgi:pyruvate/2-oxoglutarate dehydrogenase complex dihydrolipoamide dehydrogenase (E3) component